MPRDNAILRLLVPGFLLGLGAACASTSGGDDADAAVTDTFATDSDDGLGLDTGLFAGPTWWGLGGGVVLAGGAPDPTTSALALLTRGRECTIDGTIAAVEPLGDADGDVPQRWRLTLVPDPEATCAWRGPAQVDLGFGRTDPQLAPAAARAGVNLDTSWGLWLATAGDPLLLVGVAAPGPVRPPDDTDADTARDDTGTPSGDTGADSGNTDTGADHTGDSGSDTDVDTGAVPPAADTGEAPTAGAPDGSYRLVTLHGIPLGEG